MKSETHRRALLYQPKGIIFFAIILVFLSGFCLFAAELLDTPDKTVSFFFKNPDPKEFCFTTERGEFLRATDKKIVAELSSMIHNKKVSINSTMSTSSTHLRLHERSVRFGQNFKTEPATVSNTKSLHLSWGEKGYDFEITKDGRVQMHMVGYFVADKSLFYRVALKIRMILSGSRSICYESEPDKKIYQKARELLDTVKRD